jgi:transcriptional regulator with XRE-family HTH domain
MSSITDMIKSVSLDSDERSALKSLGQHIRRARILRGLSQEDMAERSGVNRKTYMALEAGESTVGIALLARTMSILNYPAKLAELLASDPIGDDLETIRGPKRARARNDVADF